MTQMTVTTQQSQLSPETLEAIYDLRATGVPVAYIAGTLSLTRRQVEDALSSKTYGDGLAARLERKIDLLLDSVEDKIDNAKLGEVVGGIRAFNEMKRLELGQSTANIDIHSTIREVIREQVRKRRATTTGESVSVVGDESSYIVENASESRGDESSSDVFVTEDIGVGDNNE